MITAILAALLLVPTSLDEGVEIQVTTHKGKTFQGRIAKENLRIRLNGQAFTVPLTRAYEVRFYPVRPHRVKEIEQDIRKLIKLLGSDLLKERDQAYQDLQAIGGLAIPQLQAAARAVDREIKRSASRILVVLEKKGIRYETCRDVIQGDSFLIRGWIDRKSVEIITPFGKLQFPIKDIKSIVPTRPDAPSGDMGGGFVELRDGSWFFVRPPRGTVDVETHFGKLKIPFPKVQELEGLETGKDHRVGTKSLRLRGRMLNSPFLFEAAFGQVKVAPTSLKYFSGTAGGGSRSYLRGNTLVVDHSGYRVVELDRFGKVVWQFKHKTLFSAQRLWNGNTLMTFHSIGPVMEVDRRGKVVWQRACKAAVDAKKLVNGNYLISEYHAKRVIEVDRTGKVAWQYAGIPGNVYEADRLRNGNTLISTYQGRKVIEVNRMGKIVWDSGDLGGTPLSADRLGNGNTLIALYALGKVVEIDRSGKVVWQKSGLGAVYDAHRLPTGHTLIAEHTGKKRVLEVDRSGKIVWEKRFVAPIRVYR